MVSVKRQMPEALRRELDLSSTLENMEDRTAVLEKDFAAMLERTEELIQATERHADRQETELQSWRLLEAMLESGGDSRDILDHVRVFFNFLMSRMKSTGADILDIKMLWHLHDNADVKPTFLSAVDHFGLGTKDLGNLKVLLALTYKLHTDLERDNVSDTAADVDVTGSVIGQLGDEGVEKLLEDFGHLLGKIGPENMQDTVGCFGENNELKARHGEVNINDGKGAPEEKNTSEENGPDKDRPITEETSISKENNSTGGKCNIQTDIVEEQCITEGNGSSGEKCTMGAQSIAVYTSLTQELCVTEENNASTVDCITAETSIAEADGTAAQKGSEKTDISGLETDVTEVSGIREEFPVVSACRQLLVKKRLGKALQAQGIDLGMQETILRIMITVIWMLNVGRKEKSLSITNT